MKRAEYLIAGMGIAGASLALELISRNKRILVTDIHSPNSASRVAAGMFNPVTSKVRNFTWMADQLFPYLDNFYRSAERFLEAEFYFPKPIYRPFLNADDARGWDEPANAFVKDVCFQPRFGQYVRDLYGGIELNHSGYVDTNTLMHALREKLKSTGRWIDTMNNPEEIAEKVIYCEGTSVTENPYFNWLPVNPLKGEIIMVQTDITRSVIFNRSVYLIPAGTDTYKVGATYDRTRSTGNSAQGIQNLEDNLRKLLAVDFKTTGAGWGFRPTVPDRRPILGVHPEFSNRLIFNGLGTKGITLAPWFANHLANWMDGQTSLMDEINISRFYPLYFKYLQKPA
jgi:glycine oxidase